MAAKRLPRHNGCMSKDAPAYTEFDYTDAYDVDIHAYVWLPGPGSVHNDTDVIATASMGGEPHAIVQISHGVGEHALRYDAFARALTANGFAVYANDHRGHGQTGLRQHGGDHSKLGRLGVGGLRAAEAASLQLGEIARERHPEVPLIVFGHSWGSLMTQRIMNNEAHPYDAIVLSGSAYRTPLLMESGDLNKKWRSPDATGFEWLSRDPQVARDFLADPLCFSADIAKLFGLADAARLLGTPASGVADVPLLIVSGREDPLTKGEGLRKLAAAYRSRGMSDVTLRLFDGRHELLNELNREAVTSEIITWMLDRFSAND